MTSPDSLPLPPTHTILTPRLRLRTSRVSDAEACKPFVCDEQTMKYSTTGAVAKNDARAVENWLKARVLGEEVFSFMVTLRKDGDGDGDGDGNDEGRKDGGEEGEEVVIGMMGSHHWPEVGYLLDPAHTGKGYATEALLAFIPAFFAHMSATNPTATSINYICAETDQDNIGSQKVLLKCGFEFVERLVGGFDSPVLGLRDSVVYRIARPGTELEIGNGEEKEGEGGFVPPVQ